MSPEALARLREALRIFDADVFGEDDPLVDFNDLRALLDAYGTARAERDEALDALEKTLASAERRFDGPECDSGECEQCDDLRDEAERLEKAAAVLAKAGRR